MVKCVQHWDGDDWTFEFDQDEVNASRGRILAEILFLRMQHKGSSEREDPQDHGEEMSRRMGCWLLSPLNKRAVVGT